MSDWLEIHRKMTIPVSEITDVNGIVDINGAYHVRITRKTPVIDFICKDRDDAAEFYKAILKSCNVVDLKSYKFGK